MGIAYIKCREKGRKAWWFLSDNGINRLRVHAVRFADIDAAQRVIDANRADNPEWDFKAVAA